MSPDNSVDLTNLRDITGGDPEMEKELFYVFLDEAKTNLAGLKGNTEAGQNEEWRRFAHAFKGISHNLGATRLGDLCYQAQEKYMENPSVKAKMFADIEAEYQAVKTYLESLP